MVTQYRGKNLLDFWQNRATDVRKVLRGWNINYSSAFKKEKRFLTEEIDKESEILGLDIDRFLVRKGLEKKLHNINREEEIK